MQPSTPLLLMTFVVCCFVSEVRTDYPALRRSRQFSGTQNHGTARNTGGRKYEVEQRRPTGRSDVMTPCPGEQSGNRQGVVESPNFPDTYPSNSDCYSVIRVKEGEQVALKFETLFMERNPKCSSDFVEVFDGPSIESKSLGRFCRESQKSSLELMSTGNTMMVHFHSDDIVNLQGFRARYRAHNEVRSSQAEPSNCRVWTEDSRGFISSPNYPEPYPANSSCRVPLDAGPNNVITLYFIDIQLDPYKDCPYDKIEVRDGATEDAYLLGRFCGAQGEAEAVTSTGREMFFFFNSDSYLSGRGFKAEFLVHKKPNGPKDQTGKSRGFDDDEEVLDIRESPKDVSLRYKESHIFRCLPASDKAAVTWFKEDEQLRIFSQDPNLEGLLLAGNNTLWVKEMDVSLRGNYTCRLSAGRSIRDIHFKITYGGPSIVKPACDIVLRKIPGDLSFTRGETIILPCEANGAHVATHWTRNQLQLRTGASRVTILPIGFLTINDSRPEDSGVYACVTTDVAKNCSRSFSAAVVVMPKSKVQEGQVLTRLEPIAAEPPRQPQSPRPIPRSRHRERP